MSVSVTIKCYIIEINVVSEELTRCLRELISLSEDSGKITSIKWQFVTVPTSSSGESCALFYPPQSLSMCSTNIQT